MSEDTAAEQSCMHTQVTQPFNLKPHSVASLHCSLLSMCGAHVPTDSPGYSNGLLSTLILASVVVVSDSSECSDWPCAWLTQTDFASLQMWALLI